MTDKIKALKNHTKQLKEEGTEMKKSKKIFCEFILPFSISQAIMAGCLSGWVYLWVNM